MIRFLSILVLFSVVSLQASYAQKVKPPKPSTINKYDNHHKPHGMWVHTNVEKMGEPAFTEFGKYVHGLRYGKWYKIDSEGDIVAIENYRNDVLDGQVELFTDGKLTCRGMYRGLNPSQEYDSVVVEDPVTGEQKLVGVLSEYGTVKHGMWYFYDAESGRLVREEEYQIDVMIHHKDHPYSKSDSLYYNKRNTKLPHKGNKGGYYKPPEEKRTSYMD